MNSGLQLEWVPYFSIFLYTARSMLQALHRAQHPRQLVYRADTAQVSGPPSTLSNAYTTTALTSILACAMPMMALIYLAGLSWVYRYSVENPRPINKVSGSRLQRFAPRMSQGRTMNVAVTERRYSHIHFSCPCESSRSTCHTFSVLRLLLDLARSQPAAGCYTNTTSITITRMLLYVRVPSFYCEQGRYWSLHVGTKSIAIRDSLRAGRRSLRVYSLFYSFIPFGRSILSLLSVPRHYGCLLHGYYG